MGVFWVTRAKDNMCYHVCKKRKVIGNIVRDDEITLKAKSSKEHYPQRMRRVVARVEVFFKQIKQTLQICDSLGHSKQAIRWQLWSALLLYLLLRFQAWSSDWPHSFARLFTMIRGLVWDRFDLSDTLRFYRDSR